MAREAADGITTRAATVDDLPTCAAIWRDALNDYLVPMAQPEVPDDVGGEIDELVGNRGKSQHRVRLG